MHKPVAEKVKETEVEVGFAFESGDKAGSGTETGSEVVIEFGFETLVKFDLRLEAETETEAAFETEFVAKQNSEVETEPEPAEGGQVEGDLESPLHVIQTSNQRKKMCPGSG